ncbi:Colicin-D [Klebsiella huaxiensis]|uniref:Colicin-like bacteriocin tRNase domain-containing protein n=1 Tax=Klebsiella huaxiensis TaxID=2153354 RepID=A0ABT6EC78_9ENTR|nr:colicin-like bacteriocin tRNase domain-containing protein [Klebsiella huaxiensis]MDG1643027.1 colicin-like bacteriocin tRNase domain-containing protein [Klebsiella huaxiensis]VUS66926.1 Colicin-D [Klebsiella huaxiensis]VUT13667.1 Colicin-D [Klebsiella huaxiensis]
MSDINYDPASYNNGVPPEPGVVWNGDTWGWPTRGYDIPPLPGDTETLMVTPKGTQDDTWPKRPDIKEWYVPGEKTFDPVTGNGWVPEEDGYNEALPAGVPEEMQAAIKKVKGAPLKGGMSAVDIWKLKPAPWYPGKNKVIDPVFIWFPLQALTDSNISAMSSAPESIPVHTRILDDVQGGTQLISAVSVGASEYNLPVVKAVVRGNYYAIGRLPGVMRTNTFEFSAKSPRKNPRFLWDAVKVRGDLREAGFTVGANTSDFIVWFPQGSGVEPLYFSMTMQMPTEPLQRRQEVENNARAEAGKLRAEAEANEATRKALFAKAGVQNPPVYTLEMVNAATTAMMAPGVTLLGRAPGMTQLSAAATTLSRATSAVMTGSAELSGWFSSALWRGAVGTATASAAGPMAAVASTIFFSPPVGAGSDKVPGRDIEMLAAQARLFTAGKVNIEPGMKSINLPVRGFISTNSDGRQSVNLVKTGTSGVSPTVPVLNAVRDKATGLDKITVPAVAGAPSRTILVNPVPLGPAAPSHTGNNSPVPVTPVHTGTEVKQADSIVTTTFPIADLLPLQDLIYWQPDVTGTGVEPIYVMLNSSPKSVNHKHKHYPPKGVPWKDIVSTTANGGSAKFKPDVNIPEIDTDAWANGQITSKHPTWKVKKYDRVIGAYAGKETQWVVVKESQGVIHSHPISEQKAREYMK